MHHKKQKEKERKEGGRERKERFLSGMLEQQLYLKKKENNPFKYALSWFFFVKFKIIRVYVLISENISMRI